MTRPRVRYTRQYDDYSCGAVAVVNAIKWTGKKISWRTSHRVWIKKTNTSVAFGCYLNDIKPLLLKFFIVKERCYPTLSILKKELRDKKSLIIKFQWPKGKSKGVRHFFFIEGQTTKGFYVINLYPEKGKARRFISAEKLRKLLSVRNELYALSLTKRPTN